MKYIVLLYIALGCVLSSAVGIEYSCDGQEYTASPFIFRQKSLGSSLTHYYSVAGLIINTGIWSAVLPLFRLAILKLVEKTGSNKAFKKTYRVTVCILLVFTTLNIAIDYIMLGRGFEKGLNYWYFDLDNEAKDWGVDCEGKWGVFLLPK